MNISTASVTVYDYLVETIPYPHDSEQLIMNQN